MKISEYWGSRICASNISSANERGKPIFLAVEKNPGTRLCYPETSRAISARKPILIRIGGSKKSLSPLIPII